MSNEHSRTRGRPAGETPPRFSTKKQPQAKRLRLLFVCKGVLLLDFDLGAGFHQLGLDGVGLFLGNLLLDGLGGAVDELLGFLQAQTGDLAEGLDDGDLVGADPVRVG